MELINAAYVRNLRYSAYLFWQWQCEMDLAECGKLLADHQAHYTRARRQYALARLAYCRLWNQAIAEGRRYHAAVRYV